MVVSHVRVGLAKSFGNFGKATSLKEVQPKRLALLLAERIDHFMPPASSEEPFEALLIVCSKNRANSNFGGVVCNTRRVKALSLQATSAQKCLRVGDLENPRTSRASRTVEQIAFPLDI
jgi:hypothetical protein